MGHSCSIHIGLPKTATKTLQWHLFARHNQIEYLGRFDGPEYKRYRKFDHCRDSVVQTIMRNIAWGKDILNPDIDLCRRLLAESIAPGITAGRVPLWSWESLSTDTFSMRHIRAKNLRRVFGECKIFITIRHPLDLVESTYFQVLKREITNREMRRNLFGRYSCYFTIEQWLEKYFNKDIMPHLEYTGTIEMYSGIFGKDAMKVFLFEDLKNDPAAFMESVCTFIGVDTREGIRLAQEKRENSRWTAMNIKRLKIMDKSLIKYFAFRFPYSATRRMMLKYILGNTAKDDTKARAEIPQKWRERIADVTREGNRWLAKDWSLPIDRYGYPL